MKIKNHQKGTTLIELTIYLGLFGILVGGAVVGAFNIFEGSSRSQTRAMLQEEGDFLLGKINWVLSGAQSIASPPASPTGTVGTSLLVSKWDTTIGNPILISLSGTDLSISTSSNPTGQILNNADVRVSRLLFTHTQASGDNANPETIQFSFTVSALTPNGMTVSEYFPTTTVAVRR